MANYETLLDEPFQQFCQSLLLRDFPYLVAMPIGMPDGGRDALSLEPDKNIRVLQVKFSRNPSKLKDPVKWITDAVDGELPKIQRLATKGATEYILVTNVPGTSHLDVGRIDQIQAYLNENVPIPALCLWRDDLDRRLENAFDLKLRYPSLLDGSDAISLAWSLVGHGEDRRRRESALRTYLAHHYERERTVRFKQAELVSTNLNDLFIDVPVNLEFDPPHQPRAAQIKQSLLEVFIDVAINNAKNADFDDSTSNRLSFAGFGPANELFAEHDGELREVYLGGASLFLDARFTQRCKFTVLEGAPGQGKSTLTQYIAQIHRTRLLERHTVGVEASHLRSPIYIPIRIELRDFATWINGEDPWEPSGRGVTHSKGVSLEAAIAAQIERHSGGITFNVADLAQVAESMPVLLLLDGLDEVADLTGRHRVVEEIVAGAHRLAEISPNLNVVVTSRPSAVENSPSMPREMFGHLKLAPIPSSLTLAYGHKWAKARRLEQKDRMDLLRTLEEKMDLQHMADLARNTMQLSILLSLMHVRGASLPDKRTELYDEYVDIFFNREAEKSKIVRQHRSLLIDFHRYLGFQLHAMAEQERSNGSISFVELEDMLRQYLMRERRSVDQLNEIVTGTVERVVALVSRVEGSYEFEVQPLREYFAARYLYDTAPYSPPGRQKPGALPDRFDAISYSPYWQNVTRFLAGCFSKGELLELAERLTQLTRSDGFKYSNYPRALALSVLQDWVMTQSVRATEETIDTTFDKQGIRLIGYSSYYGHSARFTPSQVHEEVGGKYLAEKLWRLLETETRRTERAENICTILKQCQPRQKVLARWREALNQRPEGDRFSWLSIGDFLGVLRSLDENEIRLILGSGSIPRSRELSILSRGGADIGILGAGYEELAVLAILNHPSFRPVAATGRSQLAPFAWAIHPGRMSRLVASSKDLSTVPPLRVRQVSEYGLRDQKIVEFVEEIHKLVGRPDRYDFSASLSPWRELTKMLDEVYAPTWTSVELGIIAAAVRSSGERGAGASSLFDTSRPITDRVRNARRRMSQVEWWANQHAEASTDLDLALWTVAAYAWATPATLSALLPKIDNFLVRCSGDVQRVVTHACRRSGRYAKRANARLDLADGLLVGLGIPTLSLIAGRLPDEKSKTFVRHAITQDPAQPWIASAGLELLIEEFCRRSASPGDLISLGSKLHETGAHLSMQPGQSPPTAHRGSHMRELSAMVAEDCWHLPEDVIGLGRMDAKAPPKPTPVADIAHQQGWFASPV